LESNCFINEITPPPKVVETMPISSIIFAVKMLEGKSVQKTLSLLLVMTIFSFHALRI